MQWCSLNEAAKWLAGTTHSEWDERAVLSAAIRYPIGDNTDRASNLCTAIGVVLPPGHKIIHAIINVDQGREYLKALQKDSNEPLVAMYECRWRPVALLQSDVSQLLAAGWVEVAAAREWLLTEREDAPPAMDIVEPPFIAKIEHAGIYHKHLKELAGHWLVYYAKEAAPPTTPAIPEAWQLGIRREAWDAAQFILQAGNKLTANALEKQLALSPNIELKRDKGGDYYTLKTVLNGLNDRQLSAKPKTIAGWVTVLKKLLNKQ